jgi:hypothetical protein
MLSADTVDGALTRMRKDLRAINNTQMASSLLLQQKGYLARWPRMGLRKPQALAALVPF